MHLTEGIDVKETLKSLPRSPRATFNSEKVCLDGTRTVILQELLKWIVSGPSSEINKPKKSILLLHGMAGTGKSTIANTIASRLYNTGRLGASYCFSRDVQDNANNIFLTIALSIAELDECFKLKLAEGIAKNGERSSGMSNGTFHRCYSQDL